VTVAALEQLPSWAFELLRDAPVAHLGVLDADGHPRVLPITYVLAAGELWSAIDDKPKRYHGEQVARVRWLRARPQSALTVDRYDADWSRLAWVQVLGRTSVLKTEGQEHALQALAARYPSYEAQPPSGPLLRLTPERAISWRADDASSGGRQDERLPARDR
jgi:PPOX class probable F420-dependent enzyme